MAEINLLSAFTGAASGEDGTSGLVPAPSAGDQSKFLRGDGAWQTVSTQAYSTIQDEGISITQRSVLNFIGDNVTVTDNSENSRTNVTISAGVTSVATGGLATGGPITSTGTITVTAATQADMETASSTTTAVTPAVVYYHPTVPKAFVRFNGTGTVAIVASYNVTSITDHSTGVYTINYTNNITNAIHSGMTTTTASGNAGQAGFIAIETDNVAYVKINTAQAGGTDANMYDPTIVSVTVLGAI